MKPFFKGIHLTLKNWRGKRRSDGWKYSDIKWSRLLNHLCHGQKESADRDVVEKRYGTKSETKKNVKPDLSKGCNQIWRH